MLTKDELLSAVPEEIIGNPWVQNVIETLRGMGGEAVAFMNVHSGKVRLNPEVKMTFQNASTVAGTQEIPLYTATTASSNGDLAKRLHKHADNFIRHDKDWETCAYDLLREAAALGGGK